MKFATSTALFLSAMAPVFAYTKVDIFVKCKGANINKISVAETTLVANALESSYNDVHSGLDSDDSELADVHYGTWADSSFLQQGGGYGGGYGCQLCPNDDDALMSVSHTAGHKAWEAAFVTTLMESGHKTFAKIKSCSIKMSPHASTELATVEDTEFSDTRVIIEPHCPGINFGSLSVSDNTMAGHILEDTFNRVHSDDKELSDVSWGAFGDFDDVLQQGGGYGGGYGCQLCPNDDDAMLGLSGKGMKAWEAAFASGLAESGIKAFGKVKNCSIKMKPSPYYLEEPNVDIDVKCSGGPSFHSLSVAQSTFVAHSLQKAYNTVHGPAPNDDSELTNVFFYAPAVAQDGQLTQGGGYGGGYGCQMCPNDDDAMLAVGATGAALVAWEKEFVSELASSVHPEFQTIKSCSISMKPHAIAVEEEEEEIATAITPVRIDVKCNGLNFGKLSVGDVTYAGHVLEDSYNTVHGAAENDDSFLIDVVYGERFVQSTEFLQQGGGYGGGYGCQMCPNDDDAMLGATGAAKTKWEEEFTLGLLKSGRPSFQKVSKCSIQMSTKDFLAVVEEPVKCGLRACADA